MTTTLTIDTQLLDNALKIGGLKTRKDTVNLALEEFAKRRKQAEIISLFGTVDDAGEHDYKKARQRIPK